MSRALLSVFLLLAGSATAQIGDPDTSEVTFRTGAELVVLDVGVQTRSGELVRNLQQGDFRVFEDGKLQPIRQFSREERPATIGLVVDASGSMRHKRAEVIAAALGLIAASNPLDEVFVVNFNDTASLGLPPAISFSDNASELRRALSFAKPEGRTALNDAVLLAIQQLQRGRWDKKALLVVSDGGDNNSRQSFKDVLTAVQQANATIYTIGLFDPDDPDKNPQALRRMADISGGRAFEPRQIETLGALCQGIAKDIRSRYTLAYVPSRKNDREALRHIAVIARQDSKDRLQVRTRTRYLLPARHEGVEAEGSQP